MLRRHQARRRSRQAVRARDGKCSSAEPGELRGSQARRVDRTEGPNGGTQPAPKAGVRNRVSIGRAGEIRTLDPQTPSLVR
jgi:hypothetical protein